MDDVKRATLAAHARQHWRLYSVMYLLLAMLFFALAIWQSKRHGIWWPLPVVAIMFLVQGARMGPPRHKTQP